MFGRQSKFRERDDNDNSDNHADDSVSDRTLTNDPPSKAIVKRATRTRAIFSWLSALLLLIAVAFLILVLIANTKINPILNDIYFIRIDLRNIVPTRIPNAILINSIAQTLGLHDYYTVGLWNFCEQNKGQPVSFCSTPKTLYWFNPVNILQNELLAGASIALPAQIDDILNLIRLVSNWMFGLFFAGIVVSFVTMFLVPVSVISRWATLPIMVLTFFAALFTTVATVLATVLYIIMADAITAVEQLNISASIGVEMFAFMWIAAAATILAWLIQLCLTCCCASRRDVRTGRKRGSRKAWTRSEKTSSRQ